MVFPFDSIHHEESSVSNPIKRASSDSEIEIRFRISAIVEREIDEEREWNQSCMLISPIGNHTTVICKMANRFQSQVQALILSARDIHPQLDES